MSSQNCKKQKNYVKNKIDYYYENQTIIDLTCQKIKQNSYDVALQPATA